MVIAKLAHQNIRLPVFDRIGVYLVLSALAALGICVMCCGALSTPGAVSAYCTGHVLSIWVHIVVLGVHLVLFKCWLYV